MDGAKILKREEIAEEFTWDLSNIFSNDDDWMSEYESLKQFPEKFSSYREHLGDSADTLLSYLKLSDEVSVRLEKLYGYAHCKSDQDISNSKYQDLRSKAMSVYISISSATAFSAPEITEISDDVLESFYAQCPELEIYRRSLYSVRRRKAHTLSSCEEALLSSAHEIADAPDNICGILRNADLKFPSVEDKDGLSHQLTGETLVPLLESSDRVLRENAFKAYYKQLGQFKNTIASSLDAQFKQLKFFSTARKYDSTICASLDATEVPVDVYLNLINTVNSNLDKMYEYVSLRKKLLGVEELHMYDVYTPVVPDSAEIIEFSQAKETVLDALSVMGSDYTDLLKEAFANRWIDVYENEGKRGGAYSTNISRPHPYVLLNQKDNLDSMFTLAHEMGHALHSWFSTNNQPICTSDYVIFVAEVASTVNEVLLMKHLLSKTSDKKQRAYLINHFLDQFKGTLYRQTMFAEFELEMGRMCENGDALTADILCEKYLDLNKKYFGPEMVSDDEIALEWARIPHFFYDYYVFQYATGFSAAVAIANNILKNGEPAVADYKRFLSGGCSSDPISLLKIAGVDMSTPDPVNSALSLFGELIGEMSELVF